MQPPAKKQNWRLKKTLARKVTIRPIEDEDVKWTWAAYKLGALPDWFKPDMKADEFKEAFVAAILTAFDGAWIATADTQRGHVPVGMFLGNWHPASEGELMIVSGAAWFPWGSGRNILESTVKFLNEGRKDMKMMFYVRPEHKRLYEVILKHGIMRRIGTSYNVFDDVAATVFETRQP